MGKLTVKQRQEIVDKYLNGVSTYKLEREYNYPNQGIFGLLKRRGIPTRPKRRYSYDTTFFERIDTHEKAYWLGNLYADGNLHRCTLALKLNAKDVGHIGKFKAAIKSEHPIKYVAAKDAYVLKIHDVKLPEQLQRVGIVPKKARILKMPALDQGLRLHFIRGFFDGDGWFTRSHDGWQVGFASCSRVFIEDIRSYFAAALGKQKAGSLCCTKWDVWQLIFGGNKQTRRIADLMYKDATVYLDRKHDTYLRMKESP